MDMSVYDVISHAQLAVVHQIVAQAVCQDIVIMDGSVLNNLLSNSK